MLRVDHLVVGCAELERGAEWLSSKLETEPGGGGEHRGFGTHNKLWRLNRGRYLELIALKPEHDKMCAPWFGLVDPVVQASFSERPRLLSWVARASNDGSDAEALAFVSGLASPISINRGEFKWRLAIEKNGGLCEQGIMPYLIWWDSTHPTEVLPESGLSLAELTLQLPDCSRLNTLTAQLPNEPIRVVCGDTAVRATLRNRDGKVIVLD